MAKPIITIGIPDTNPDFQDYEEIQQNLAEKLNEYHVLIHTTFKEEVQFNCFYEKDFNEVKYDELKEIIKESITK